MKERPILFSGAMVRAIMAGRKTQTRRVLKTPNGATPSVAPGDQLWVRETWVNNFGTLTYRADCHPDSFENNAKGWRPSIYMPRALSRIILTITDVCVEQVQDISEDDAKAEGVTLPARTVTLYDGIYRDEYARLWNSIYAKRGYAWHTNPWVWVISFEEQL